MQGFTTKQLAEAFNISERIIYMARAVRRLRPDLAAKCEAGEMKLGEAYRITKGKAKPTSWDRLLRAWNNASEDDRGRFMLTLMGGEEARQRLADARRKAGQ